MANRFLNNITINDEYTLPAADGTVDQLITTDGAGQLSFVDQDTINAGSSNGVCILVKNISAGDGGISLSKGDPVYIYGDVGASNRLYVDLADADSTATNGLGNIKMPCVGLLDQDLAPNGEGTARVTGKLTNLITSPIDGVTPAENDTIYVKSGGGLTLTKPTGSTNLIQNVGQVGRVSTSSDGNIVVSAILRSNDVPNLPTGKIWVGDSNTTTSTVVHLDETNKRLGLNTVTPSADLHVKASTGNYASIIIQDDEATGFYGSSINFQNRTGIEVAHLDVLSNTTNAYLDLSYGSVTTSALKLYSGGLLALETSGSPRLYIDSTGDVGIGETSPAYKFEVRGDAACDDTFSILDSFNTYGDFIFDRTPPGSSPYPSAMKIYNDTAATTYLAIGNINPVHELTVDGTVQADNYVNQRVVWSGGIDHLSNTSSAYYFYPVGYIIETTTNQYYNNWVAPYDGRIRKIVHRGVNIGTASVTPTIKWQILVNGTVVHTTSNVTPTGSGANFIAEITLGDTDATFSATDRVQVRFNTVTIWNECAFGISVEYTN